MRHTIALRGESSIKSQKIHTSALENFRSESIVKIQQQDNFVYAICVKDSNEIKTSFQKQSVISSTYLSLNGIDSERLVSATSIPVSKVLKNVEMQTSEIDEKIVTRKQNLIASVFLDQVSVVWPGAKIVVFYDDANFVTLIPKVEQVSLIDPYAAISFSVCSKKSTTNLQESEVSESDSESQTEVSLLMTRKTQNLMSFGYDNVVYVSPQSIRRIQRTVHHRKNKQSNKDSPARINIKIHLDLPFCQNPSFSQFIHYLKDEKKHHDTQKSVLVQITSKKDCSENLKDSNDDIVKFECSKMCKKICGLSQRCFLDSSEQAFEVQETKSLSLFMKEISRYEIILKKISIGETVPNSQLDSDSEKFALKLIEVLSEEGEFIFFQNYYPFFLNGSIFELRLVNKLQEQKRVLSDLKPKDKFILIRNCDSKRNETSQIENSKSMVRHIKEITTVSQVTCIEDIHDPSWWPFVKQIQMKPSVNERSFGFAEVFGCAYQRQLSEIDLSVQQIQSRNIPKRILITTYSANGKTYLRDHLEKEKGILSWLMNMRDLKSSEHNQFHQIVQYLETFIEMCPYKVVFCDDIDSFLPNIEDSDQMRQKQKHLTSIFAMRLREILKRESKILLATAKSESSICSSFGSFDLVVKLKNPNRQLRAQIAKKESRMFEKSDSNGIKQSDYGELIQKTESLSLGAFSKHLLNHTVPTKQKKSLKKNDFSTIVGLQYAKDTIQSVIEKPNKFGFIYDKVKIKVPRGILLYGATGNGKTALGCAVEDEFAMKFFTVKGSDILSKYIGGSEAAVREIFEKALSVSPSVIFFDEFESIVPRRNSSGTGVTDRVVNQFLCYLDGVSSTTGVFIIAASSRPDLIDPALLRPGRIDSHVYIEYPNAEERKNLLQVFAESVKIEVEIDTIIKQTEGFSYSDLIGLLKELRIKQSSLLLKKASSGGKDVEYKKEDFRNISEELYHETLKSYRIGTDAQEQKKQKILFERFREGKGPDIKKQKFVQM